MSSRVDTLAHTSKIYLHLQEWSSLRYPQTWLYFQQQNSPLYDQAQSWCLLALEAGLVSLEQRVPGTWIVAMWKSGSEGCSPLGPADT